MPSQQVLQKKKSEVIEAIQLMKNHEVIGIASLYKVRAPQLQQFKKDLAEVANMRVIKNTLMERAIEDYEEESELEKLTDYLKGTNIYLFTDLNPFKLSLILKKSKIKTTAKAGDIAAFDVVVPAGNTGQPPGPIISQLNAVGLPTRIESGSVWINKDTLVVKKGEIISERLASVLSKLGIKPVEAGLELKVAYDKGLVITQEQLQIDVEETRQHFREAHSAAFALSLSAAYPTGNNIEMLVQVAHKEAYTLALKATIPIKETIKELIRKAHSEMLSLSSRLPSLKEESTPAGEAEKS